MGNIIAIILSIVSIITAIVGIIIAFRASNHMNKLWKEIEEEESTINGK